MSSCGRSSDSYDIEECEGLAFDHARIITEAVLGLREDVRRDMKLAFDLLCRIDLHSLSFRMYMNRYGTWNLPHLTSEERLWNMLRRLMHISPVRDTDLPNCSHEGMMQGSRDYSVVD